MPYIKKEKRAEIVPEVPMLGKVVDFQSIDCAGDLNFAVTYMIKDYLKRKGLNYQNINDVAGALVCINEEFHRRTVGPYEDTKIEENGDV